jgi:prevent-host-death family protein
MIQITDTEFRQKLTELQDRARREPLEIVRRGRRELVLMSADHYDWLLAAARRVSRTVDAPDVIVEAIRRAEMDPEHAHLDELMK